MKIVRWIGLLAAATLLAGCGDFWQAPSSTSSTGFSLSNSGNITVTPGATTGNIATITVTPGSSFTGTVTLTCAVTAPTGATNAATCGLSSTSVSFSSSTSAQSSTLTATTSSTTTTGAYDITVTGVSGSVAETTTVCVEVGTGTCSSTASTSGNFYILNSSSSTSSSSIAGFYISSKTLTPISGSSVTVNGIAYAVAIAPNGKFLCVSSSDGVYAYPINSGVLGTGVQVTSDLAYALQIDSTDSWLIEAIPYVSGGGVTLNAVPINSSNGTPTGSNVPTAPFTITSASMTQGQQGQMVISPDNSYIFVALEKGGTIVVPFSSSAPLPSTVSAKTIGVANTGGSALSVAVDPSSTPRLFYIGEVLGNSGGTSGGLRAIDYSSLATCSGTTCTLTQASGSPIASGGLRPTFILPVTTPDYVYVADGAGSITGFAVSGSSSPYTIATGSTVTVAQPAGMALDSTGSYVFEVGSSGSPYFDAYSFDATTTGLLDSQVTSTSVATSIAIVAAPK
jgi:hypothetical protein